MGKRLSTIIKENEPLRRYLEAVLSKQPDEDEPSYGEFGSISGADLEPLDIRFVDLARDLETAGVGDFIIGRRGHPSRLEWRRDVQQIAREGLGIGAEQVMSTPKQEGHTVNLPRERKARLELPTELTDQEAEIIIAYLRAIVPRQR